MIVKVQLPLSSNVPNLPVLIYNEDRSLQQAFEFEDCARLAKLMDGKPKAFFNAHIEDDILYLDDIAEWQSW